MPVRPEDAPRHYADICHRNFSRWGVWDPAHGPKIGSYGFINVDTGALDVEGNVYDPEFQTYIDECDGIKLADHPPVYSDDAVEPIMSSMWVRKKSFEAPPDAPPAVDSATTSGQWWFQRGRSCAVLLLHNPHEQVLPDPVLEALFKVPQLEHKHLVTKVVHCSAYARYLSGADCEHITLSLNGSEAARPGVSDQTPPGLEWWTQGCESGYLHTGVDQKGELCYAPAFSLQQRHLLTQSLLRDSPSLEPDLWCTTCPPWHPLDDDGIEVPIDDSDYESELGDTGDDQM